MGPERFLASLIAVILGLVLAAVVAGALLAGWVEVASDAGFLTVSICTAAGLAVLVCVLRKGPAFIRRGIDILRVKSPEPLYSCLVLGVAATLSVGAFMSVPILLLGHARPEDWDFERIPRWMAIAFLTGLVSGLPLGVKRKRERRSQSPADVPVTGVS